MKNLSYRVYGEKVSIMKKILKLINKIINFTACAIGTLILSLLFIGIYTIIGFVVGIETIIAIVFSKDALINPTTLYRKFMDRAIDQMI